MNAFLFFCFFDSLVSLSLSIFLISEHWKPCLGQMPVVGPGLTALSPILSAHVCVWDEGSEGGG